MERWSSVFCQHLYFPCHKYLRLSKYDFDLRSRHEINWKHKVTSDCPVTPLLAPESNVSFTYSLKWYSLFVTGNGQLMFLAAYNSNLWLSAQQHVIMTWKLAGAWIRSHLPISLLWKWTPIHTQQITMISESLKIKTNILSKKFKSFNASSSQELQTNCTTK